MPATSTPLLEMRGIRKAFPGVQALREVDLTLHSGEVLALLGENGAGKSTLIRILGGVFPPDSGSILIDGQPANTSSPIAARRLGITVIHQEMNLIPGLSVADNICLGREASLGLIPKGRESATADHYLKMLGATFSPDSICRNLTISQQQIVEIAKALAGESRILVMDEPTASLSAQDTERLFGIIQGLRSRGLGIIYISHRLAEIDAIADRAIILRDGQLVGELHRREFSRDAIIEKMVGRKIEQEFPRRDVSLGPCRLQVERLSRGSRVRDVSFSIRQGEVVGMTGLVGAGRTETARLLYGADRPDSGRIQLDGASLTLRNPRDAIRAGIALLTEDRKRQGLVLSHSLTDNFALPNFARWTWNGVIQHRRVEADFLRQSQALRLRMSNSAQAAGTLSGGNQQKLCLARWLQRNCDVIIFDEPTRGIDVGARFEIYQLINELAIQGKAILVISSDLTEVLGISDRILVMRDGRIVGELADARAATPEEVMAMAIR